MGSIIITLVVGSFVDVIPRSEFFDPRRRVHLHAQLAGRSPRPTPDRPEPTVLQWVLLAGFFLGLVAVVDGGRQVVDGGRQVVARPRTIRDGGNPRLARCRACPTRWWRRAFASRASLA
jgi:hypothetical protein